MRVPRTLRIIGGTILYASAVNVTLSAIIHFLYIFKLDWKIGLALTLTSIGLFMYGVGPALAGYAPGLLIEWAGKKWWKLTLGFIGILLLPYLILFTMNSLVLYVV